MKKFSLDLLFETTNCSYGYHILVIKRPTASAELEPVVAGEFNVRWG